MLDTTDTDPARRHRGRPRPRTRRDRRGDRGRQGGHDAESLADFQDPFQSPGPPRTSPPAS